MENRREFIKSLSGIALGLGVAGSAGAAALSQSASRDRLGDLLPLRPLGNTGEMVTMLGLGGWHIACGMSESEAERTIEAAMEEGVRFIDCAEGYCEGNTERRLGKLLTPKYRDDVFLMTKTLAPDAKTARAHLENSLRTLKTERLDLWQVHSIKTLADVDNRINNGVLDIMLEAKASGKARHIGFTGHVNPKVHARMLEQTDIFEVCQLPINVVDPNHSSFVLEILPELIRRKMGVVVIKSLGGGSFFSKSILEGWHLEDPVVPAHISVRQALDFVWSLPVSVVVTGADNAQMLREKVRLAKDFQPLTEEEKVRLIERVADTVGVAETNYKSDNI
jgi:predicted aldo/keto reductase-like oxidoreductase